MLILGRKSGQGITIQAGPDEIHFTFLGLEQGILRVGIEAPKHVVIYRDELAPKGAPAAGPARRKGT
jgi:carbon storage regulator CsrA